MTNKQRAVKIIEEAAEHGGPDEIRRIATYGWPVNSTLVGDSPELRIELQDEAKRVEADLPPDTVRNTGEVE